MMVVFLWLLIQDIFQRAYLLASTQKSPINSCTQKSLKIARNRSQNGRRKSGYADDEPLDAARDSIDSVGRKR
jgi:hypothetical protein